MQINFPNLFLFILFLVWEQVVPHLIS